MIQATLNIPAVFLRVNLNKCVKKKYDENMALLCRSNCSTAQRGCWANVEGYKDRTHIIEMTDAMGEPTAPPRI